MSSPPLTGSFRGQIHTIVARHRRELLKMERAGASEMVRAYGEMWQRLKVEIERLVERYMEASAINAEIGVSWVFEFNRLQNLQRQVEEELRHFAAFAESRIVAGQREAVDAAGQHLAEILMTSTGPGVHVRWDRLPVEAVSDLVGFTRRGSPLRALLDELGPEASAAVRDGLIQGLALGHNPRKVARAIRGKMGGNLVRALRIARTEQLRSYREATRRNYEANSDIIAGWRWLCAKQPRTCAMCLAMDGSFHTLKEHLDDHPNGRCHPAGTLTYGPAPVAASARYYCGQLVSIRTASGAELSFTPNHPILTPHGWVAGGLLQEGDDVIRCALSEEATAAIDEYDYQVPTRIEEIAESFRVVSREMPCAAEDFHGDGIGSEVYVVRANRLLGNCGDAALQEPVFKEFLGGGAAQCFALACPGASNALSQGNAAPPDSILGNLNTAMMLLNRRLGSEKLVGGRLVPPGDASLTKAHGDGATRNSKCDGESILGFPGAVAGGDLIDGQGEAPQGTGGIFPRLDLIASRFIAEQSAGFESLRETLLARMETSSDCLCALASDISVDRILKVSVRAFSGHVYSLQTREGWYIANGIIAHNCAMVPVLKGEEKKGPQWETGSDWLARQSPEVQERILGKAGTVAYRAGAVQLTDYVGQKRSREWGSTRYAKSLASILGDEEAHKWAERANEQPEG